jgi:hypothetical protein
MPRHSLGQVLISVPGNRDENMLIVGGVHRDFESGQESEFTLIFMF